jgi:SDR family mycofactocin-dependent oxidoreductase
MPGLLEGKVGVVTGAGRGQGRSHCVRLAEEGADVIAMDICAPIATVAYPLATPEDLAETVRLVEARDRRIVATQTDVRDSAAVRDAVDAGVAQLGRLDIVVANAGISTFSPATELEDDVWQDMIDTNLTGVWNVCRATLRHLIDAGRGGSIVITSSSASDIGTPNLAHYCAAKAGLVGLMRSLAVELGPHSIRVNTIHPTTVDTPMIHNDELYKFFKPEGFRTDTAEGRRAEVAEIMDTLNVLPTPWTEPVDVSNAMVFLASDQGRYITGTELRVDAGSIVK